MKMDHMMRYMVNHPENFKNIKPSDFKKADKAADEANRKEENSPFKLEQI